MVECVYGWVSEYSILNQEEVADCVGSAGFHNGPCGPIGRLTDSLAIWIGRKSDYNFSIWGYSYQLSVFGFKKNSFNPTPPLLAGMVRCLKVKL